MKQYGLFFLALSVFSGCAIARPVAHAWARAATPALTDGAAQSIGAYTAGCLRGAVALPQDGAGYQTMRLSRKRVYGHPDLIHFIEKLGQTTAAEGWGVLLIGDLGQPRGGPTLTGHRSHQTGLDVDIWYLLSQQAAARSLSFDERETWGAPSVLAVRSDAVDASRWSLANEKILEAAARMPEVERIFVNPGVKRQLCASRTPHDWLRKIRPWWGHDDHFHVRLKCPAGNSQCQGQESIPEGDGCDASLSWWFSAEALEQLASGKARKPAAEPALPEQCQAVLKE
ncbi:penicillin-insensitive murein endopeptidase [Methylobacter sp. YRD-M1]|uniref:penicillin-insensitive murein endopeptidase n=1 Tax=Methylobacter sp. YRD-M1 TaxID=2911520 RepID=UPI00227D2A6F|nr:penicillin-insensitive murein endopeptidase [Methylobacter sp. YRD-M1]WAK00485.1 penicillin-insensitive murein endopeptidase [Methylobacter sp. YRD-M1]